jgi:hypothetical protein
MCVCTSPSERDACLACSLLCLLTHLHSWLCRYAKRRESPDQIAYIPLNASTEITAVRALDRERGRFFVSHFCILLIDQQSPECRSRALELSLSLS